ncbi:MAG: signal recognition particle-docking protein FtsY [Phyllobacteriaceae bacterium]|nr:signal recognition particle-docking protein FtsY [Phyllobacteriaceae bacterium]
MSEGEKRGLFSRLFGGKSAPAQPAPVAPAPEPATEDTVEAAAVAAPEPVVEPTAPVVAEEPVPAEAPVPTTEPEPAEAATVEATAEPVPAPIETPIPEVAEPPIAEAAAEPAPLPADAPPEAPVAAEPEPVVAAESAPLDITPAEPIPPAPEAPTKRSWWQKLKSGLGRTSSAITSGIGAIFTKRRLDEETLEELEDVLIQADLGLTMATRITDVLRKDRFDKEISDAEVREVLAHEIEKVLAPVARPLEIAGTAKPHVVLVVGVNGTGKTTTIGKLSMKFAREGRKVTLAAGDTFRAAAVEQLKIWGKRTGAAVIARETGADAAGLAFDALVAAKADGSDVVMIDTAGRLQNRAELMAELEKIVRVIKKHDATAPHDVVLTLDATTGQNAINQVEIFGKVAGVTGLVMTKLDGTARGGILVAVAEKFGLPVHFVGVGEGVEDLEPFDAKDFARAVAGLDH